MKTERKKKERKIGKPSEKRVPYYLANEATEKEISIKYIITFNVFYFYCYYTIVQILEASVYAHNTGKRFILKEKKYIKAVSTEKEQSFD